jgi:hypothetical protein
VSTYQPSRYHYIKILNEKEVLQVAREAFEQNLYNVQLTGVHLCALFPIVFMDVTEAKELVVSGPCC